MASLISPLRYDIVIRSRFFVRLRERQREPLSKLQEVARGDDYFTWFKHVECFRFYPQLLADPDALMARFDDRVARAVATFTSYQRVGFNRRHPVSIVTTRGPIAADSGALVDRSVHIADGCHRLALLHMNHLDLGPGMYRTRPATRPVLDNTALLLPHIDLEEADYVRFLSCGFAAERYGELDGLRAAVERDAPHRLPVLDSVVSTHRQARLRAG